jgi:hypothetical protein
MLFDVYGRFRVRIAADGTAWLVGDDGKGSQIDGVVIPRDAVVDEVIDLLDVAFHEVARPGDLVTLVDGPGATA